MSKPSRTEKIAASEKELQAAWQAADEDFDRGRISVKQHRQLIKAAQARLELSCRGLEAEDRK